MVFRKLSTTFDELWALLASREEAVVDGVVTGTRDASRYEILVEAENHVENPPEKDGILVIPLVNHNYVSNLG